MFGLDKIFGGGGLFGKFFDSIGLGWMGNVLSLAVDVMSGNWLGAAKDVFDLVSKFSDSWSKSVSPFQPLGDFALGGGFGGGLTSERLGNIINNTGNNERTFRGLNVIQDTVSSRNQVAYSQRSAIGAERV